MIIDAPTAPSGSTEIMPEVQLYAWVSIGHPGAWGHAFLPSYVTPTEPTAGTYAGVSSAPVVTDPLIAEMQAWQNAGARALGRIDSLLESLGGDEAEGQNAAG